MKILARIGIGILVTLMLLGTITAVALTQGERDIILYEHNTLRHAVGSKDLQYDDKILEPAAQAWAKTLADRSTPPGHSPDALRGLYGENVANSTPTGTWTWAIRTKWGGEKEGYECQPFSWERDKPHAHYTQMVWGSNTHVGCGMAQSSKYGTIFVCQYKPGGNRDGKNAPYDCNSKPPNELPWRKICKICTGYSTGWTIGMSANGDGKWVPANINLPCCKSLFRKYLKFSIGDAARR